MLDSKVSGQIASVLARREIVFLHVAKSAGSSFWHSLVKELSRVGGYGIDDAYARSIEHCGNASWQVEAVERIVNDFNHTDLRKLVLHYHSKLIESGPVLRVLPNAGYMTLYRDAEARMRSGFRHWVAEFNISRSHNMMDFWRDFFSFGFCRAAPFVFGMGGHGDEPTDDLIGFFEDNVIAISFEEFVSEGRRMQLVSEAMGIGRIEPINLAETQTSKDINVFLDEVLRTDYEFADKWNREVDIESRWMRCLFGNAV